MDSITILESYDTIGARGMIYTAAADTIDVDITKISTGMYEILSNYSSGEEFTILDALDSTGKSRPGMNAIIRNMVALGLLEVRTHKSRKHYKVRLDTPAAKSMLNLLDAKPAAAKRSITSKSQKFKPKGPRGVGVVEDLRRGRILDLTHLGK